MGIKWVEDDDQDEPVVEHTVISSLTKDHGRLLVYPQASAPFLVSYYLWTHLLIKALEARFVVENLEGA